MLTDEQHSALRARFPILRHRTYLDSCSQGALSDVAEAGIQSFTESWRTSSAPWNDWVEVCEAMRAEFARFINAHPDEIAIVTSASAGINAIARAIDFAKRPKVVMGEYEFPTMGQIWLAQRSRGAQIKFLPGVGNTIPTELYEESIDEQTAVVPLTHVSFLNGFRSDVAAVTRIAHAKGALVFLDGYQDCGTRPIDVKAMDLDIYVTGAIKYLLGPPGLAFLYVKRSLIESMIPTQTEARGFEGGSPPIPNIYAARPALDLLVSIGTQNVAAQIAQLTRNFMQGTRALGIASKTPDTSVGPLVVLRAMDSAALVHKLTERGVLVSPHLDGVRFSFHAYNNLDDVNAALAVLQANLGLVVRV